MKQIYCNHKLVVFICLLIISTLAISLMPRSADSLEDKQTRIVIVSMPRLTFNTLSQAHTPNIDKLINRGAIAAFSVKARGSIDASSSGYATLSASKRAIAPNPSVATFVQPEEKYDGQIAADIYTRQRGNKWDSSNVGLGLSFQLVLDANKQTLDQAQIGSFADALTSDGRSIAIFGNADKCESSVPECFDRSVGFVGTTSDGIVKYGDITRDLLVRDSATGQLRTNYTLMSKAVSASIKEHDVSVAECSDLERIDAQWNTMKASVAQRNFIQAIDECDSFIGSLVDKLDFRHDQIYIISPNSPRAQEQLTVFIGAGKNISPGYASSSTTRVPGIVTLVDIGPSILRSFHISVPNGMNQAELDWRKNSQSSSERIRFVRNLNDQSLAYGAIAQSAMLFLFFIFLVVVLMSIMAFTRGMFYVFIVRLLSLCMLPIALVTFIIEPWMRNFHSVFSYLAVVSLLSVILGSFLFLLAKKIGYLKVISLSSVIYLTLQAVDIIFGGRLQFNSLFGISPLVAGRFSGFGNQSFALLAGYTLIFVSLIHQLSRKIDAKKRSTINLLLILLLVFIVILDGAPQLGSDVGGVLSLTPTFIIVGFLIFEKKVNFKTVLLSLVSVSVVLSIFTFIDLMRPINKRTHLGRFFEDLVHGNGILTIQRKFEASLHSFSRIELTLFIIVGVLYILFLYAHKTRVMALTLNHFKSLKLLIYPAFFLGIFGALLNDSGAIVPVLLLFAIIPVLSILGLDAYDNELKQDV